MKNFNVIIWEFPIEIIKHFFSKCKNTLPEDHRKPPIELNGTHQTGKGVFATENIPAGEVLVQCKLFFMFLF